MSARRPDRAQPPVEPLLFGASRRAGVLPGALRDDAGAAPAHEAGLRGEGVRVAVIDRPVTHPRYFEDEGYDIRPLRRTISPSHGSAVSAAVLAVAPRARILARDLAEVREALQCDADLVVCAWGLPHEATLDRLLEDNAHRVLAVRADPRRVPGALPSVRCIDATTPWPRGPYRFPGSRRTFRGLSVAVGAAAGVAALLVGTGVPVTEALDRVVRARTANPGELFPSPRHPSALPFEVAK